MKQIAMLLLAAGALAAFNAPILRDVAGKDEKGWDTLFNGKSTAGWHSYGKTTAGSAWKAEDSVLHLDSKQKEERGDLLTDAEYENFDLKLDWKISKNGNSGIIFLVNEDPTKYHNTYETGPEMQVLDNDGHPDAKIFKHRAGDLYDLIPCKVQTVKPAGQWNQAEVVLKNGHLKLILNGVKVVDTKLWDANWDQLVAGSKFKGMTDFGKFHKGHIALQDHGDDVYYRNIQIKQL